MFYTVDRKLWYLFIKLLLQSGYMSGAAGKFNKTDKHWVSDV